jgi:hypothetical protein
MSPAKEQLRNHADGAKHEKYFPVHDQRPDDVKSPSAILVTTPH